MKNPMLLLSMFFLFVGLLVFSCKKPAEPITCIDLHKHIEESIPSTISGKWNVVTDSTFADVGRDNHQVSYTGQTGDYFDFRNDGKLYIKEGLKLDTSTYKLTSDATILIPAFGITLNGVIETSHITNLTTHHATVTAPTVVTPGGLFGRKVNLSR